MILLISLYWGCGSRKVRKFHVANEIAPQRASVPDFFHVLGIFYTASHCRFTGVIVKFCSKTSLVSGTYAVSFLASKISFHAGISFLKACGSGV